MKIRIKHYGEMRHRTRFLFWPLWYRDSIYWLCRVLVRERRMTWGWQVEDVQVVA